MKSSTKALLKEAQGDYSKAFGLWRVTTEGDCEGRSIRQLGTYEGYLDEIAFQLADQCSYSLTFTKEVPLTKKPIELESRAKTVNVTLDIDSGTWPGHMESKDRIECFRKMLKGRNVQVSEGHSYASVTLKRP